MIGIDDIKKLAKLARLEIPPEEEKHLVGEVDSILEYVNQVQEVSDIEARELDTKALQNVMREDGTPHEKSEFKDDILGEASQKDNGYVKVRKIL